MGDYIFQFPRRAIRRHLIPVFLREILDKHVNLRLLGKQVAHRIEEFSHVVPLSFDFRRPSRDGIMSLHGSLNTFALALATHQSLHAL